MKLQIPECQTLWFKRLAFFLLAGMLMAGCSEPSTDKTVEENDASSRVEIREAPFISARIDLPSLSIEKCAEAFPEMPAPLPLCEHFTSPRLLRLNEQLCAYYAKDVDPAGEQWKKIRYELLCFQIGLEGEEIVTEQTSADITGSGKDHSGSIDTFVPVASTENGVWFGGTFLDGDSLKTTEDPNLRSKAESQIGLADLVNSAGDLEPDGFADAVTVISEGHTEFHCDGDIAIVETLAAFIMPATKDGGFNSPRKLSLGWENLPLFPYGISVVGTNLGGTPILAMPAEMDNSTSGNIDGCMEKYWGNIPLIGTLAQTTDGSYQLESIVGDKIDLEVLNRHSPMGFAQLPDGSGVLGSFSGMKGTSSSSGFSQITMDGKVSHWSMTYKGQTYPLDYPSMGIDYGGIPFDLALGEKADGTLLLVHTSRTGKPYLDETNGLYLTQLFRDGTQETQRVISNGKPVGLISFKNDNGGIFFASASGFSSEAWELNLPATPQLLVWYAAGVDTVPPFTSDGYFSPPLH